MKKIILAIAISTLATGVFAGTTSHTKGITGQAAVTERNTHPVISSDRIDELRASGFGGGGALGGGGAGGAHTKM